MAFGSSAEGFGRLSIIGRGRVGRTLHALLTDAGHPPTQWWSRRDGGSAEDLPAADVVIVAVADDAIEHIAHALERRTSASNEIWLHCSGSRSASVLRSQSDTPRSVGCFHPLQAIDGSTVTRGYLAGSTAAIDGEAEASNVARALANLFGMHPVSLKPGTKPLYHAAAVTVAGHAVALFVEAQNILAACGLDEATSRRMLQPLMRGAVENLAQAPAPEVITGPMARGDVGVVQRHLEALAKAIPGDNEDRSTALDLYRQLARRALEISASDLADEAVADLRRLLKPPPEQSH